MMRTFFDRIASVSTSTPRIKPKVNRILPHDPESFVQGLVFHSGRFYESRGDYGDSELREIDIETGKVLRKTALPDDIFAEGLTVVGDKLLQLTWQERIVVVWEMASLKPLTVYKYLGEGWGVTYDGKWIMTSDGSDKICFRAPFTGEPQAEIHVEDQGRPVPMLNELQWIDGWILANVFQRTEIAIIDPGRGCVTAWIDCRELCEQAGWFQQDGILEDYVLNGIAYDSQTGRMWVTGKCWDVVFEVEVEMPERLLLTIDQKPAVKLRSNKK